ncbi:MAG: site-specific integrase [Oscillospiraceae bacterium]|nr:site-specific integrase [Oscillospiraceae bacterium]
MQKKLLTNGNIFKRTDARWNGVVWYMDEQGQRKRKSFCGNSKQEVKEKITEYIAAFNEQLTASDESKAKLEDSMANWLRVFKFPSVERGTYDRLECTAKHQIYPLIGSKVVGDVTSADIKVILNHWMNEGYAYTTVKKVYNILTDYFRYLTQQELIPKNPMLAAPMIKKANFMATQGKEIRPTFETVTTFSPSEIERFKTEALRTWGNGERIYQQAAVYTLMLNTGLRTGEVLGLLNSDIDLTNRVIHLQRGIKEISRRDGTEATSGREVKVGKLKTASSKRDVPLNQAAVNAIEDLRAERYFGENTPLIPDENGDYTRPVNFRKRYYRILEAAGIERKGLHSLRHTFATTLVNGVKQPDGTIKSLSPRQVADLLGHSTSEITELYYVKKDTSRLAGITTGFEL